MTQRTTSTGDATSNVAPPVAPKPTVTKTYGTTDGKTFTDEAEANAHQELLNLIAGFLESEGVPETRHDLMRRRLLAWEEWKEWKASEEEK